MRKVDLSAISPTIGMPEKSGTLIHIQNAYQEIEAEIIKRLIGPTYSTTIPYRVNGLINTGGTVSAGSVFYDGELFFVDSFALPGTANASIDTTYYTATEADPVDFTDGTPRSVHEIRKISFGTPNPLGWAFSNLTELGQPAFTINPVFPLTITFDQPKTYYRSLIANPAAALTVTLSDAGAVNGTEVTFMFQSDGTSLALTNSLTGFASIMGIGGYTNPVTITVGNTEYFVVKYRAYKNAFASAVSIEVLENN